MLRGTLKHAMTKADEPEQNTVISIAKPSLDNFAEQYEAAKAKVERLEKDQSGELIKAREHRDECLERLYYAMIGRIPELKPQQHD